MLRTIYDLPPIYTVIDRKLINTSYWGKAIGNSPRLAPFIEKSFVEVLHKWMNIFTDNATIDEWKSTNCYIPYSSTDCLLTFYNPIPTKLKFLLIFASLLYGLIIYAFIAGFNATASLLKNMKKGIMHPFTKFAKKKA